MLLTYNIDHPAALCYANEFGYGAFRSLFESKADKNSSNLIEKPMHQIILFCDSLKKKKKLK